MNYSLEHIAQIIGAEVSGPVSSTDGVQRVFIDSRMYLQPNGSLFFAISGVRHRAVRYIPELIERGFRWFVCDRPIPAFGKQPADIVILEVSNSLEALQKLAAYHRSQFKAPVIGITGSNGKTIVKEWLFQMTQPDFNTVRSPRSYNSQVGVPLSVFGIKPQHRLAILEAGISEPGEMENLEAIIKPDIGIFTNIGHAHDAHFKSRQQKLEEKTKLFQHCEKVIVCADDDDTWHFLQACGLRLASWTCSTKKKADICFETLSAPGTKPRHDETNQPGAKNCYSKEKDRKATYLGKSFTFQLPFSDPVSVENALHCVAACLVLGMEPAVIAKRVARLESLPMRLELKQLPRNVVLVNDSYNSDLKSLELSLNYLGQNNPHPDAVIILSDVLQTGMEPDVLYRQVAEMLEVAAINQVISVGEESEILSRILPASLKHRHFPTTDALLTSHLTEDLENCGILLKGARKFEFERIARVLEEKQHDTVLEINLENLVHNLNVYRSMLTTGVRLMAMLKASAYGAGSEQLARVLENEKISCLAVAYADEGLELRRKGIRLPIVVLQAQPAVFDILLRYNLEPEIYDLQLLKSWIRFLQDYADTSETIPGIHLKLDTGMHRLGFTASDLPELIMILKENPGLQIISIFSHLSAADNSKHASFSLMQIERFKSYYERISATLGVKPLKHILNSSGLANFPDACMDMIRLGIGLYGIDPSGNVQSKLLPVAALKARILQIKPVAAHEPVGYNLQGRESHDRLIAVISAGYADGLPRKLSDNVYEVIVHGLKAPITGSVCMDVCMIDVTHIPEAQPGDEVEVFGPNRTVAAFAKAAGLIPYEVLTGISSRVRRAYFWG